MAIKGDYAYVADGQEGLRIIDISNFSNPGEISFLNTGGFAKDITVSEDYAYIVDDINGLHIIDISLPSNPVEVASLNTGKGGQRIAVSGNYAFVADVDDGLRIIDVSNYSYPFEAAIDSGFPSGVAISHNFAYVTNGHGLKIIDISYPPNWAEVGFLNTGNAMDVTVKGRYAFVADGWNGLRVIDNLNPSKPTQTSVFNFGDFAENIAVSGNYVYVSNKFSGLWIIDISDLSVPVEAGFFNTGD